MSNKFLESYEKVSELVIAMFENPGFGKISQDSLKDSFVMMHKSLETDLSIEIGAHEASYSVALIKNYHDSFPICAIEASKKTFDYYVQERGLKELGINYINALLTDHDGYANFFEYIHPGNEKVANTFSSIHRRSPDYDNAGEKIRISIPSMKGDSFIKASYPMAENISLCIDAEGAQFEVLNSFSETFAQEKIKSIYIEVEENKLWTDQKMLVGDIMDFMKKNSFSPFLRDNEYGVQYNVLFLHNSLLEKDLQVFHDYFMV